MGDMLVCTICDNRMSLNSKFCAKCGARMLPPRDPAADGEEKGKGKGKGTEGLDWRQRETSTTCPFCKSKVPPRTTFCTKCGKQVEKPRTTSTDWVVKKPPSGEELIKEHLRRTTEGVLIQKRSAMRADPRRFIMGVAVLVAVIIIAGAILTSGIFDQPVSVTTQLDTNTNGHRVLVVKITNNLDEQINDIFVSGTVKGEGGDVPINVTSLFPNAIYTIEPGRSGSRSITLNSFDPSTDLISVDLLVTYLPPEGGATTIKVKRTMAV